MPKYFKKQAPKQSNILSSTSSPFLVRSKISGFSPDSSRHWVLAAMTFTLLAGVNACRCYKRREYGYTIIGWQANSSNEIKIGARLTETERAQQASSAATKSRIVPRYYYLVDEMGTAVSTLHRCLSDTRIRCKCLPLICAPTFASDWPSLTTRMTDAWRLDLLPSDVLLVIFDHCHAFDLVRLSEVCVRFYELVKSDGIWTKRSHRPLVTNQCSKRFRKRCNPLLCVRKKWQVSHNWRYGKYEKRVLFSQRTKLMPWLRLTSDILWWSGGNQISGYRRADPFNASNRVFNVENISSDICKFVVRGDTVVTSHRDGSLQGWQTGSNRRIFNANHAHASDINGLDVTLRVIVSGSKDGVVKIWPRNAHVGVRSLAATTLLDRVWSLAIDPTGLKFAVGTSGYNDVFPLHVFDVECCSESDSLRHPWQRGAGILDMVWDSPQSLLTCGYDTYIRKWDLRTASCVSSWADPTDATLYCISSDHQYTMVTGSQFNCKAVLWDQRQRNYIQLYFMNLRRISSPVYSVCFDSCHLYGATDQYMVQLKFSGHSYKETNYRELLKYEWTGVV